MDDATRDVIATDLNEALETGEPISRLTADYDLDIAGAYAIQNAFLERRTTCDNPVVGHKIGLTSDGIQDQLGVSEPDFGRILADMIVDGRTVPIESLIAPRIEPEIGFILGESLEPPVTQLDVLAATNAVLPVLEVIDSRIVDWDIRIEDTIADNASAGVVVPGEELSNVTVLDLSLEGLKLWKNGEVVDAGVGANVLGHPARAVAWLANALDPMDDRLQAGELVLSGSFTPAVDLAPGDVITAEFGQIGSVTVSVDADA